MRTNRLAARRTPASASVTPKDAACSGSSRYNTVSVGSVKPSVNDASRDQRSAWLAAVSCEDPDTGIWEMCRCWGIMTIWIISCHRLSSQRDDNRTAGRNSHPSRCGHIDSDIDVQRPRGNFHTEFILTHKSRRRPIGKFGTVSDCSNDGLAVSRRLRNFTRRAYLRIIVECSLIPTPSTIVTNFNVRGSEKRCVVRSVQPGRALSGSWDCRHIAPIGLPFDLGLFSPLPGGPLRRFPVCRCLLGGIFLGFPSCLQLAGHCR